MFFYRYYLEYLSFILDYNKKLTTKRCDRLINKKSR